MRLPDDNKRRQIISTAAGMFASQPFHKVRLDDVAAAAGVGKGTLYVYFKSKEDLYFTITFEGIELLVGRLNAQLAVAHTDAMHRLRTIVNELIDFAFQYPQFFELMKTFGLPDNSSWKGQRDDLFVVIEQTLQAGIASGEMSDPNPALTARFIPGLIRSAMLFGADTFDIDSLKRQIFGLLSHGLSVPPPSQAKLQGPPLAMVSSANGSLVLGMHSTSK